MKIKTSIKQKITLISSGILVLFVILEISLRLGGGIFLLIQEHRNRVSIRQKGAYRILCLGESTTAMGGKNSWPSQLERILNEKNIGKRFSVINEGMPGGYTDDILAQLKDNLDKYQPAIIVTMMGINDLGNTLIYKLSQTQTPSSFLRSLRTIKLFGLIRLRIVHKVQELKIRREFRKDLEHTLAPDNLNGYSRQERQFKESAAEVTARQYWNYTALGWQLRDEGKLDDAEKVFKKAIRINPENYSAYQDLGMFYTSQKKYEEAKEMFKKAIEVSPTCDWPYIELGSCYELLGQQEKAEEMFKQAIEINPEGDRAYGGLARCYEKQGKYALAEECLSQLNKIRLEKYNPITRRNYYKLIEIATSKGIKLVCVQYPVRSIKPLEKMLESYKNDIISVDNEKSFKEALRMGSYDEYFQDSFAGDFGHCTKKGNELLAQNIARVIIEAFFNR